MPITITTWNVQNFERTDPVYADKLNYLTGILLALGSDVVALQEILDLGALQDLAARLGFHPCAGTPDSRGIRVAFLTRNPLAQETSEINQWLVPPGSASTSSTAMEMSRSARSFPVLRCESRLPIMVGRSTSSPPT